ncbi:hypothetical protein H8K39_22875 [Klebsiella pneumoniae]|uniref:hypothetical protein n=1 Tax=Klebsiella michiganensis TaxID=1134687 RepID=UPI00164C78D6|nr:hypothetical protein [Klebsiella pneumoniae]MBC5196298.1 hypothetical protein [Klebsiella pneumoniae]HBK4618625.1 hypothetical protein [Klebsiella michiganensis]
MNIETVNELIQSLESAGELSIKETKVMALAKAFKQLAAENVGLKAAIRAVNRTAEECELNGDELKYVVEPSEFEALTDLLDETPATSAYLAGIKADGVEEFAAHLVSMECHLEAEWAKSFVLEVLNVKGR